MNVPNVMDGPMADQAARAGRLIMQAWRRPDNDTIINDVLCETVDTYGREGLFVLLVTLLGVSFTGNPAVVSIAEGAPDEADEVLRGVIAFFDAVMERDFALAWDVFNLWNPPHGDDVPERTSAFTSVAVMLAMSNFHGVRD